MKQLSRSVICVDTNPKCNRICVLKDFNAISQLDDDGNRICVLKDFNAISQLDDDTNCFKKFN